MTVLAARLRHRIDFEEQITLRDSEGDLLTTWDTVMLDSFTALESVPAEVLTGAGREFNQSGQVQSEIAARITCRWFPGLMASWRIVWDGNYYNVASWETDATGRREYRIKCTTGVNDGQ